MKIPYIGIAVIIALGLTMFSLTDNPAFAQTNQNTSSIICKEGYVILTKQDGTSACVSPSTYLRLIDRGWGMWDRSMMMKQPMMMNNVMNQMIQNPELMQQWHDTMMQNQQQMQEMREQWIASIKENPQLMANMMGTMTMDPELRQQMIDQMMQHREMMQSMRTNDQWMGMMRGPMMGQGMHGSGMGMQNCPWCPMSSTTSSDVQYGTTTCPWCPVMNGTNQQMTMLGWNMHNPQQMHNMMNQVWQDPQWRQQMHNMMIQNPWHMGPMMNQMMEPMMGPMMNDPQLRQQMLDMMSQNHDFVQKMRENQQFQQSNVISIISNIEKILDDVSSSYRNGDSDTAFSLATNAYLENYEYVEGAIAQKDRMLMQKIELMMREDLRSMIKNGDTADNVDAKINSIKSELGNVRSLFQ